MKKIDFYREIINSISTKLLQDADSEFERQQQEYGMVRGIELWDDFCRSHYEELTESRYQDMINALQSEKASLKSSLGIYKSMYQKEKHCNSDGQKIFRKTDFTKLRNIVKLATAILEEKGEMVNE